MTGLDPEAWSELGLPSEALKKIAAEEGASATVAAEAIRRVRGHPAWRTGQVRSPLAFFRGVLRGVQRDQAVAAVVLTPPPAPRVPDPPPPRSKEEVRMGKGRLAALRLIHKGLSPDVAEPVLRRSFPELSPDQIQVCLQWATNTVSNTKAGGIR